MEKLWVRILISLFAGGVTAEALHLLTVTNINDKSKTEVLFLPVAIIVFFILTYVVNRRKLNK